jgi:hypothetical protein
MHRTTRCWTSRLVLRSTGMLGSGKESTQAFVAHVFRLLSNPTYISHRERNERQKERSLWQDYIHKVPVIMHDNLQGQSHKTYSPPTSVTWLVLLRKQSNTGNSTALIAETLSSTRTLPAHGIILGSLTLPAPEAGEFMKLMCYSWGQKLLDGW